MEIRPLHDGDDRASFESGDADLDRFFRRFAGQNQFRHHIGVTYIALENRKVLGFATIAPGNVEIESLPEALRQQLPSYPLPILRLARLAVSREFRGKGIGAELLRFVVALAVRLSDDYGCIGVVVDAKAGADDFYKKYGFVPLEAVRGRSDARPAPLPMFLSMRKIRRAGGA